MWNNLFCLLLLNKGKCVTGSLAESLERVIGMMHRMCQKSPFSSSKPQTSKKRGKKTISLQGLWPYIKLFVVYSLKTGKKI